MRFITHFKKNLVWQPHLTSGESPLIELINLEDKFIWKRALLAETDATLIKKIQKKFQCESMVQLPVSKLELGSSEDSYTDDLIEHENQKSHNW